jgi:hypothetical protein
VLLELNGLVTTFFSVFSPWLELFAVEESSFWQAAMPNNSAAMAAMFMIFFIFSWFKLLRLIG